MNYVSQRVAPSYSDRVRRFIDIVEVRRAVDAEDLEAIYRLRYNAYRRENFIRPNSEKLCIDELDDSKNHYDFGFYLNDRLLSSMRLHIVTKHDLQCATMLAFPEIVGPWLEQGKILIDPSRFVTDLECTALYPELPLVMMRLPIMAAQYFQADHGVFTVRREHVAYYKRVFRSEPMSGFRKFPYVDFDVVLMRTDTNNPDQGIFKRYPYFRSDYLEQRALFRNAISRPSYLRDVSEKFPA
jgi:hypothetical protein